MILSDAGIKAALADGTIGIDPRPTEDCIETSAVDLTLSNYLQDLEAGKLYRQGSGGRPESPGIGLYQRSEGLPRSGPYRFGRMFGYASLPKTSLALPRPNARKNNPEPPNCGPCRRQELTGASWPDR